MIGLRSPWLSGGSGRLARIKPLIRGGGNIKVKEKERKERKLKKIRKKKIKCLKILLLSILFVIISGSIK